MPYTFKAIKLICIFILSLYYINNIIHVTI